MSSAFSCSLKAARSLLLRLILRDLEPFLEQMTMLSSKLILPAVPKSGFWKMRPM